MGHGHQPAPVPRQAAGRMARGVSGRLSASGGGGLSAPGGRHDAAGVPAVVHGGGGWVGGSLGLDVSFGREWPGMDCGSMSALRPCRPFVRSAHAPCKQTFLCPARRTAVSEKRTGPSPNSKIPRRDHYVKTPTVHSAIELSNTLLLIPGFLNNTARNFP